MKNDLLKELEETLAMEKVDFSDFNELEELVTPFCDGGGCSCTGGLNCN